MKKNKVSRSKQEKRKRLTGLIIIVAVLSAITLYAVFSPLNKKDEETTGDEIISSTEKTTIDDLSPIETPSDTQTDVEEEKVVLLNLLSYYQKNQDMIGWIKIDNTLVDYPVMYSGDNDYYMTHTFDRIESKEGAIFLDFRCDFQDFEKTRNVILYGHRMKDESMFKTLTNYRKKSFFNENPTLRFDTLYEELTWEVFTVFKTKTDFYYIETEFESDDAWLSFIETCQSLSYHENDIKLYKTDIVLTLSTCAVKDDERFVVMARLKR